MAFLKSIFKRAGEFFQSLEKKKLITFVVLAAVVVTAGIVGAVLLNQVHYTVLYSGLDAAEAGTIKTLLDDRGVKSEVRGTGAILVPEDKADELRIELASEGYPSTGFNYDIFSSAASLGATDLERRTYLQYQLQENMRATLTRMDKVENCVVIVNLAAGSSFVIANNTSDASVAVMLDLKSGQILTDAEARSIGEFVKRCVPDLKTENISIVDTKMNSYDVSSEEGADGVPAGTTSQIQLTEQIKETLTKQALRVLEPSLRDNVAVSINLSLDLDKQVVDKVEFEPPVEGEDDGLVRSYEELYNAVGPDAASNGQAGTDTNGVGTPAYVTESESGSGETSSTKTYNYELNEIRTQIEKANMAVRDLSVAVLVNSELQDVGDNVEKIRSLVAKAIGVKPDYISIELMPFLKDDGMGTAFEQTQQAALKISRDKLVGQIITVVAVCAALVVIFRFFIRSKPVRGAGPVPAGAGELIGVTPGDLIREEGVEEPELTSLVLKKSSEAEKIEELMDRYPETVAQILRTWLSEDN